jgi:hypothetical protein
MATLNKVYTFATGNEGFTLSLMTWVSVEQALENRASGRNTTRDGTATITDSYGSIGIPEGATITNVQLKVDHRCNGYNVVNSIYWDAYLDGTIAIPATNYSGITSYTTASSSVRNVDKTAEDTFLILLDGYCRTANNASALASLLLDNVELIVTYEEASYNRSGTVLITNGTQESVSGKKHNSGIVQFSAGFQENLISKKTGLTPISISIGDVISVSGENSTTYDKFGSVSVTSGDNISLSKIKSISMVILESLGAQVSVSGNSEIPTYDFAVSVNESIGVQENVSGIKSTRASPEMTDGINLDLFGVKSIIAITSESIGVEKTVSYYKSTGQSISLSNGIRLLVAGTNATTYFCSSTVSLNGGDQTILSGLKQSMFLLAISDGITGSGQGSKATERAVKISAGDIGSFLSTKDSGGLISVYEGVRITVIFKLPYSQLMAVLEYEDRAPLIAHQEFMVTISFSNRLVDLSAADHQVKVSSINRYVKLEVEYVSLQNNTVRLKAEFRDFDGQLVSPDDVLLKLYNGKRVQIGEAIPVLPASEGVFTYDYVLETDVYGSIFYEFSGIVNNLPILGRNRIDITWM